MDTATIRPTASLPLFPLFNTLPIPGQLRVIFHNKETKRTKILSNNFRARLPQIASDCRIWV